MNLALGFPDRTMPLDGAVTLHVANVTGEWINSGDHCGCVHHRRWFHFRHGLTALSYQLPCPASEEA
jgi:hypothetical protein